MSTLKPDKTNYTSQLEAYGNYNTLIGNMIISGSVTNGSAKAFTVSFPYTRTNTRADIYIKNASTGNKTIFNGGARMSPFENIYQFVSTEVCFRIVSYSATQVNVQLSISNNTGATINLINQTLEVSVVLYDAPF